MDMRAGIAPMPLLRIPGCLSSIRPTPRKNKNVSQTLPTRGMPRLFLDSHQSPMLQRLLLLKQITFSFTYVSVKGCISQETIKHKTNTPEKVPYVKMADVERIHA